MDKHKFTYDVVFSLAGENVNYVSKVSEYITKREIRLWYYKTSEADLWGKNNIDTFHKIFTDSAQYCVLFISKYYIKKIWPNLERQFIQSRWLRDHEYLLPARFDKSVLTGLPDTINYTDLTKKTPEEFGELIIEKIKGKASSKPYRTPSPLSPPIVKKPFNIFKERDIWVNYIKDELELAVQNDSDMDLYTDLDTEVLKIRVIYRSKLAFSINIYKNGFASENGLSFYADVGEIRTNNGAVNAWGIFDWSKEKQELVLNMTDVMFFYYSNDKKSLTKQELLEAIWNKIKKAIESQY